jgi:hypothetical protein
VLQAGLDVQVDLGVQAGLDLKVDLELQAGQRTKTVGPGLLQTHFLLQNRAELQVASVWTRLRTVLAR